MQAVLAKRAPGDARPEEELDHAVRQIISRAVAPEGVVDIFAAAGLEKPDISILSEEFLAEVRGLPQKNLAVELLRKLLQGELRTRRRQNVVQARSFAEMLEQTIRRYQNRAIEAAQVIEELIQLAQDMRQANARGEVSGSRKTSWRSTTRWRRTTVRCRCWGMRLCVQLPRSWCGPCALTSQSTGRCARTSVRSCVSW